MYIIVSIFHVIACLTLILVILLQAGRGGGLSDMFGGGMQQQQKLFGTESNAVMAKATTFCAVLFMVTSIVLGILTTQRSRSLVTPDALKPVFPASGQKALEAEDAKGLEAVPANVKEEADEVKAELPVARSEESEAKSE